MKIERTLQSELPQEILDVVNRYLSDCPRTFSERVEYLGLNPALDLKHADLSFENFTNSDIRGYNFTGSNLGGVTGSNVTWDESTILNGADVSDSIFAYELAKRAFVQEHPELNARIARLKNEYWANTIIAVERALREGSESLYVRTKFAEAVFDEVKDRTVRSNILLYLGATYNSAKEHKEFLYSILAEQKADPITVTAVLDTLATLYSQDLDCFNTLRRFLRDKDPNIVRSATNGVFSSVHFFQAYDEILSIVKVSNNSAMRRALVGKIVNQELGRAAPLFRDDLINNYIDYDEPIFGARLERIARKSFNSVPFEVAQQLDGHFGIKPRSNSGKERDDARVQLIIQCSTAIGSKYGIEFKIQH